MPKPHLRQIPCALRADEEADSRLWSIPAIRRFVNEQLHGAHYRHSGAVGLISEAVICCRISVVEFSGERAGGFGCAMLNG